MSARGIPTCTACGGDGYTLTLWGTHECDCVRDRIHGRVGWYRNAHGTTHYFAAGDADRSICKREARPTGALLLTEHSGPLPCSHCLAALAKL